MFLSFPGSINKRHYQKKSILYFYYNNVISLTFLSIITFILN